MDKRIENFWNSNPIGHSDISNNLKTDQEYFDRFDQLREAEDCEPPDLSEKIHGYSLSKGKKVLDVGCGNGYVLSRYSRYGAEVHGVDLTDKAIELSQKRFSLFHLQGDFKKLSSHVLPHPSASFDIVCSMGVLHHIPDPRPLVGEIERVLKPGGLFIGMLYNQNSYRNLVTFRARKWIGPDRFRGKSLTEIRNMNDGDDCPYVTTYTRSKIKNLLGSTFKNYEFSVNKLGWSEALIFPWFGRFQLAAGALNRLFPHTSRNPLLKSIGWNLYFKARKK